MRVNYRSSVPKPVTHEGAPATPTSPFRQLERSVLSCMLWEDEFYESGESIAKRIEKLVGECPPSDVQRLARTARSEYNLRHAPLHLCVSMIRAGKSNPRFRDGLRETIADVIQRPDELAELLSLYWKDKKQPLSKQLQRGLGDAFVKFNAYSLAKYNQDNPIKLRDVLFLSHAKPVNAEQAETWQQLVNGTLPIPNTWEVRLTEAHSPAAKRAVWESLLRENALGAMALIRNLRNMEKVDVDAFLLNEALRNAKTDRVLPFRFITASRYSHSHKDALESMMLKCLKDTEQQRGKTIVLVDVSGSMDVPLSARSEMLRWEAAGGLAILAQAVFPNHQIHTFSHQTVRVPSVEGFKLIDAIGRSQSHGGTYLGRAMADIPTADRVIVITDEQSHDVVDWNRFGMTYVINVGSYKNGVSYHPNVVHLDGFSDAVIRWIGKFEQL